MLTDFSDGTAAQGPATISNVVMHAERVYADQTGWIRDKSSYTVHEDTTGHSEYTSPVNGLHTSHFWQSVYDRTDSSDETVTVYTPTNTELTISGQVHNFDTSWYGYFLSSNNTGSGTLQSASYDHESYTLSGSIRQRVHNWGGSSHDWGVTPTSSAFHFDESFSIATHNLRFPSTVNDPSSWSAFFENVGSDLGAVGHLVWNEALSFGLSPGSYAEQAISSTLDVLAEAGARGVDAFAGWVDGTLDAINPFDSWVSVPNIGPVYGHADFYNGGYIAGTVTGVAAQFLIGAASGGGLVACGGTLSKLARLYNVVDTVAGMVQAGQHIANGTAGVGHALAFLPALSCGLQKAGALFKSQCFAAGTQVITDVNADGTYVTKNIQDVQVGDYVLSRDQDDPEGPLVKQQVTQVFQHQTDSLRTLSIQDARGNVETLRTTDDHPFWVDGLGWLAAKDLEPGTVVTTPDGGTAIVVHNTSQLLDQPVTVYNLEVAEGHTYFVEDGQGDQTPVWVHNTCALSRALGIVKGSGLEGAHIVPIGTFGGRNPLVRKAVAQAQSILRRARIGINSAANGFPTAARNHFGTHTNVFLKSLPDKLKQFGTKKKDVLDALLEIKKDLGV